MTKEYMMDRILRDGYKVTSLGKNIKVNGIHGSTSKVFYEIYGYVKSVNKNN